MEENSDAPIAALVRLDGAPPSLPALVMFSAQQTSITIGRADSNNVTLVDKRVSKLHCRLTLRTCKQKGVDNGEIMKRVFIRDLSSFGTFVNGQALQKEQWVILQEGDILGLRNPHGNPQLGEYRAQYQDLLGLKDNAPVSSLINGDSQVGLAPAADAAAPAAALEALPGTAAVAAAAAAPAAVPVDEERRRAAANAAGNVLLAAAAASGAVDDASRTEPMMPPASPADPAMPQPAASPADPAMPPGWAAQGQASDQQLQASGAEKPIELRIGDPRLSVAEAQPAAEPPRQPELETEPQLLENAAAPPSPLSECSEVSAPDAPAPAPLPAAALGAALPGALGAGLPGGQLGALGSLLGALPNLPGAGGLIPGLPVPLTLPGQSMPLLLDAATIGSLVRPGAPPLLGMPGLLPNLPGGAAAALTGLLGTAPALPTALPSAAAAAAASAAATPASASTPAASAASTAAAAALARPPPVAITVEEELVGKIIGRGGEIVKQLQRESGARIDVSKVGSDTPAGKRIVYVSGTQACIDRAKTMIDETLNKAREIMKGGNPNGCVIKVSQDLIGKLIGRGGEMIKDLEKESGARIDIRREPTSDNQDERMVHITGPYDCIEYAKKAVEDRLGISSKQTDVPEKEKVDAPPKPVEDVKPAPAPPRSTQARIEVQQELIRLLIGKGGDTINMISKDCGVRIEIARGEAAERAEKRAVNISGNPDCIEKAKAMIKDTLSRSRERQRDRSRSRSRSRNRSRSRSRSRSRARPAPAAKPLASLQDSASKKVMHVAQEFIGMLIGKGGETIIALTKDTGARIEVSKDDRDTDRTVTLSGSEEAIGKATTMIEDIINRARERVKTRVEKHSDRRSRSKSRRRSRSRSRGRDRDRRDADDTAIVPLDRRSPAKENCISEKIYIDEVEMPFRPNFMPEHEDGLLTDLEIFIRGLPKVLTERDLWEHLCRLGASDVKEILLLRRQRLSKGMAYVVFNRHDHAMLAKSKLNGQPSSSIPCGGQPPDEHGTLMVRFSESERCINGRQCVYCTDMAGLLLGTRGEKMDKVKEASGLRKVVLTGRSMRSFGEVDEDPRLHLVVYYESSDVESVTKAIRIWGEQLAALHKEIVEKMGKGMGKGMGKPPMPGMPMPAMPGMPGMPGAPKPGMPMPGMPGMPMPPPYPVPGYPPVRPEALPAMEVNEENPVIMQRRQMVPASTEEPDNLVLSGPKIVEATCLRGQELRWQPWPDVTKYNEEWVVLPIRWGYRGELFVLLRKRDTGELRVCAADLRQPVERWPVLSTPSASSRTAKYKSFTFREHLFVIGIDRESGSLKVYHLPDPAAPWAVAFETTLEADASVDPERLSISRSAKLHVFYSPEKFPHVIAVEPNGGKHNAAKVFCITDPGKKWSACTHSPQLSSRSRVMSVYTRTKPGSAHEFDVALFSVDLEAHQIFVHAMQGSADKPWLLLSSFPFKGDSRLCCTYVPGKPEPVLMAGSPTERMLKLCHLNVLPWAAAKRSAEEDVELPKVPVLEEKLSRQMGSIWPPQLRPDAGQTVVATPIDCTADLPVSRHPWITMPAAQVEGFQTERPPVDATSTALARVAPDAGGKLTIEEGKMCNLWCHDAGGTQEGEILIVEGAPVSWVKVKRDDALPANAFKAGETKSDGVVYVCRNTSGGVGKLNLKDNGTVNNLWYQGEWFAKRDGEILCVGPVPAAGGDSKGDGGYTPAPAPPAPATAPATEPASAPTPAPTPAPDPAPVDPANYNPDALCDGHKASERVDWLEKNKGMQKDAAIKVVMEEFPDAFSDSWLPGADCGGVSAQQRAQWLVDNKGMTMDDARHQVRSEFPAVFGGNWWNPDAICDGAKAQDRAQWLVENNKITMEAAKQQVRIEFPAVFGAAGGSGITVINGKFPHTMSVVQGEEGPKLRIAVTPTNPSEVSMVAVHYQINGGTPMNFDIWQPEPGTHSYVHTTPNGSYPKCPPGAEVSYWLCCNINGLLHEEPEGACPHPDRRLYWTAP